MTFDKQLSKKKDMSEKNTIEADPNLSPDDILVEEFCLLIARIAMRLTKDNGQHNNDGNDPSQEGGQS